MRSGTIAEQRSRVESQEPHIVLLGAGASVAAVPSGDKRGIKPPLMASLVPALGLEPVLREYGVRRAPIRFEKLWALLHAKSRYAALRAEMERRIYDFFAAFELPNEPTVYDHLLLSLRRKDVVATFNWDPLLVQAYDRNLSRTEELPRLIVLHGCVAVGYCPEHPWHSGRPASRCGQCRREFVPTPLLYPGTERQCASEDRFIALQWHAMTRAMQEANVLTIFGCSVPSFDSSAMRLLCGAWSRSGLREMLSAEVIDVGRRREVEASWKPFLFSRHRRVCSSVYDSWLGQYPRRTCEAALRRVDRGEWPEPHPLPAGTGFDELYQWLAPFLAFEREEVATVAG